MYELCKLTNARLIKLSITKTNQCLGTKNVIEHIKLFKIHELVKKISKGQEKKTNNFLKKDHFCSKPLEKIYCKILGK